MSKSKTEKQEERNSPSIIEDEKGRVIGIKPKSYKTRHRQFAMIAALKRTFGIVSTASQLTGIHRATHYAWLESDREYREKVEDIDNVACDFVESKLFERIAQGSDSAIQFHLRTKGKKRGYIETIDLQHTDNTIIIKEGVSESIELPPPPGTIINMPQTG